MNKKRMILIGAIAIGVLAAGGGATWAWMKYSATGNTRQAGQPVQKVAEKSKADSHKYVGLDGIIVMLKPTSDDDKSHYASVSLVLETTGDKEEAVKDQLLRIQSIVVSTLSVYAPDAVRAMSMPDLNKVLNDAFRTAYQSKNYVQPFSSASVTKFLVE